MLRRIVFAGAGLIAFTSVGFAADLPVKARPLPPPPPFSWTGFYIGAQVGYAAAHDDANIDNPVFGIFIPFTVDPRGVIGGGHIGYNYQVGQWVLGVEGTIDGTSMDKTVFVGICPLFCGTSQTQLGVQGSVRGRVGIAFDRLLLYGTGGAAIADITNTYNTLPVGGIASIESTQVGWTAGAGLAYAFTDNWSIRGEYRHSDFGHFVDKSSVALFPTTNLNRHVTQDQGQIGISYRF